MTFEDWFKQEYKTEPEGFTYECFKIRDLKAAFENGWNSCRGHWSGMTYDETVEIGQMNDDF